MLTESYTYLERAVSTECVFFTFKFFKKSGNGYDMGLQPQERNTNI